MSTKKGRIYGKGAPFKGPPQAFGGGSCPKLPPPLDPPLPGYAYAPKWIL